ncbi:MAG: oxygen-independent coproporphyrinogen III oxidase [Pseudomonadota bacterium]
MTTQNIIFDLDLIKHYDKSGPRYTSYPTAVQFHDGFGEAEYRAWAAKSNESGNPLSLYFHIPFCDTVCYYCGCNKVVTKDRGRASPYLERLHKEIALQGALFDKTRTVDQLHWGGGTPTFISHDEMRELMRVTGEHFNLRDDDSGEYSIEIDPREVKTDTIALLRELGFNRMSLGVQDFDERVQKAVNRIQSEASTMAALSAARSEGFKSISIDLIYGLPHQSVESFARTLDKILAISPDRLSVFNYAHLPELFKPQRRINEEDLPAPQEKLDILQNTIEKLTAAGYVYIGMDHFAKPDDELAVAQREGTLYRNFQGYSTHADCDLIGMGSTSIGQVGDSYSQNLKELEAYYERIDAGSIPVFRGYELNSDDKLRRAVITDLICHFDLEKAKVEQAYNIRFDEYFAEELKDLAGMEKDGLLTLSPERIQVADAGKLLIRNICMVFDRYLREKQNQRFSKVI